ncbi:MAG: DUF5722 domain-containing protein, partial [Eubacteriales bacterium]
MKSKYLTVLFLAVFLVTSLPIAGILALNAAASPSLGTVAECVVNEQAETVRVSGSIKHSVLVSNREGKIAVYRFDPWEDYAKQIRTAVPLATMDMTIRFEFEIPCKTALQRMSLYAVAIIDTGGEVSLISEPQYVNHKSADTSDAGFKTVLTGDTAAAVASHAGSAIIDVYLDRLDNGNKSGYIFNVDSEMFYFDRDTVGELDSKVLTYTASGCKVYFRFLISPHASGLDFCTSAKTWATNKCVVVSDTQALKALYASTYFLISRYDGDTHGKVDGIILGRGADMPLLYNYALLVSENYNEVYARSLTLIGLAAAEAVGDAEISLIVPVSDSVVDEKTIYAEGFLNSISEYLDTYTKLTFTVMCESRHNPYKLSDDDFTTEIVPEETTGTADDDEVSPETDTTEDNEETNVPSSEISSADGETSEIPTERHELIANQNTDGYYCTDNIKIFVDFFNKLKKNFDSVNDSFGWCWYPAVDSSESALGVCYSYNYMKLATLNADFYAVAFENDVDGKFSSISHLFKYIDTINNYDETEYARAALGISDWSELIDDYYDGVGVFNILYEKPPTNGVVGYTGSFVYLDHTKGAGDGGWYRGLYCDTLGITSAGDTTSLKANMKLDEAGVNQAEIGYILKQPEPLLIGDAITFDIICGEDDDSLYELTVYIYSDKETIISGGVIRGGKEYAMSVDVSEHDKTVAVNSIKISLKRITGEGDCVLSLSRVTLNSFTISNEELVNEFDDIRDYLHSDTVKDTGVSVRKLVFCCLILASVGIVA